MKEGNVELYLLCVAVSSQPYPGENNSLSPSSSLELKTMNYTPRTLAEQYPYINKKYYYYTRFLQA